MTQAEQRVALATWLGWSCIEDCGKPLMMPDGIVLRGYPPEGAVIGKKIELPDFLNDLNAVHEAEKHLTNEQKVIYFDTLNRTTPLGSWMVVATAGQRCEALLRCLSLWRD